MYVEKKSSFPPTLCSLLRRCMHAFAFQTQRKDFKNFFPGGKPCVVSPTEQGVGGSQDKPGKRGKWERRRGGCRSPTVGSWKNPPFLTYVWSWQQSVNFFLN